MKNMLTDLRDKLFEQTDWILDRDITGEAFKEEAQRQLIFNEHAKTIIAVNALMIKASDTLYGLPVSEELRIIPPGPAEKPVIADGRRKSLLQIPKAGRGGDA